MRTPWARLVSVLGLVVGLTAGCIDETDPSDDDRSSEEFAADEAAAEEIVLTLDDFDPGWEESPTQEGSGDEFEADLADCLGIEPDDMDSEDPSADSPDFTSTDEKEVSASVLFSASPEAAMIEMEHWRDEDMAVCIPQLLGDAMTETFGDPAFDQISFADLGDDVLAYRVTIPLRVEALKFDVHVDIVVVRVGRVGVIGTFASGLSPFPTEEAEQLMGIMVDRVPANA